MFFTSSSALAVLILFAWIAWAFTFLYRTTRSRVQLPFAGARFGNQAARSYQYQHDALSILKDGQREFPGRPYQVTDIGRDTVVLPQWMWLQVTQNHDKKLVLPTSDFFHTYYTEVALHEPMIDSLYAKILPLLSKDISFIQEAVQRAISRELGSYPEGQARDPRTLAQQVLSFLSWRLLVGDELLPNDEIMETGVQYTNALVKAMNQLRCTKSWARWFVYRSLVAPLRAARFRARKRLCMVFDRATSDKTTFKSTDAVTWLVDNISKTTPSSHEQRVELLLGLNFAILFSATSVIAQVLCDMAFRPRYMPELRQEVEQIHGKIRGKWSKSALGDLNKVDSFVRETYRLYPTGATNISRLVVEGFALPDGTYLPAGTYVQTSILLHNLNDITIQNPAEFDGFRWSRLREVAQIAPDDKLGQHRWIQITKQNLAFGYRSHACPGRSFADVVFKMFFAEILLKFDMTPVASRIKRPKSETVGERMFYDPAYPLLFRPRGS